MNRILVTGGAGYIGSHTVVELINAGYEPVIADNLSNSRMTVLDGIEHTCGKRPEFHLVDFSDREAVRALFNAFGGFDGVIHFAAFKAVADSVREPLKYYRNNVQATEILLSAMLEFSCRHLVFSSSCTVYGQPASLPVSEETPFGAAHSPYGRSKQICEHMITETLKAGGNDLAAVMLRYFNPIGAHPLGKIGELPLGTPENLVPYLTQSAAGIRGPLTIFGDDYNTPDGTCIRDYIHVCDLAEAHVSAMRWLRGKPAGCEAVNLGTGKGNSVREVIDTFTEATGLPLQFTTGERRRGDVEQIYASADKARNLLNWCTTRSLREALVDAWNWQQQLKTREKV